MKKTIRKKASALKQKLATAIKAGEFIASDHYHYSCNALHNAGFSYDFCETYWDFLMRVNDAYYVSVYGKLEAIGYGKYNFSNEEERQHRMMMIAWLHEMLRSKYFTRFEMEAMGKSYPF